MSDIDTLRNGKNLSEDFKSSVIKLYTIDNKSLDEWDEEAKVEIPTDATPPQCRVALSKILVLTQKISRHQRNCKLVELMAKATYDSKFNDAFQEIYKKSIEEAGGKRLPSKDTLTNTADNKVLEYKQALFHAQAATTFFDQLMNKLHNQREAIKNILIALGIEAKLESKTLINY